MLDIRGSEGSEVATCEDPSQICCSQENSNNETEAMIPETDKEKPEEEFDYYDTAYCSALKSDGFRYIQTFKANWQLG